MVKECSSAIESMSARCPLARRRGYGGAGLSFACRSPARNRRGLRGSRTLILLFCRLRLEASSANATTPHRRNLRANDLHLITAARPTFRLMTHDLLATFIYVAHFVFTEH